MNCLSDQFICLFAHLPICALSFPEAFLHWLQQQSWLELTAVVTGLLCVYLAAVNSIWNWPLAIISTSISIYVFLQHALYADMGQNIYLTVINIYGWYYWSRHPAQMDKTPVRRISRRQVLALVLIVAVSTPVLGYTLVKLSPILHYQPAAFPYLDTFCTACSLVAQVFMARKIVENWLIWIFVDIIYVWVYLAKDLQPFAFMFAIYALIAVKGYLDWRSDYHKQQQTTH